MPLRVLKDGGGYYVTDVEIEVPSQEVLMWEEPVRIAAPSLDALVTLVNEIAELVHDTQLHVVPVYESQLGVIKPIADEYDDYDDNDEN